MSTEPSGPGLRPSIPIPEPDSTPDPAATRAERRVRLRAALQRHERLLVAFSAGVDSTYLLKAALDDMGPGRVLAVTAVSESLAQRELAEAQALAARLGAPHRLLRTHEIDDPNYAANPSNRCYFCKSELYEALSRLAVAEGFAAIADGTNADDVGDVRPGRQAARERGVVSPLLEAGLRKADIRALSRELGLPTWDKPEMPCLSSRIPYGSRVEPEKLRSIEAAEEGLRACGIRGGRVRHHGDIARLELPAEALALALDPEVRARLVSAVRAAGFQYVALDLEGYRRGRMNEVAGAAPIVWRRAEVEPGTPTQSG
jgi:uncharacterized protein